MTLPPGILGHTSDDMDPTSTASYLPILGTGERREIPKLGFLLHLNRDWEIKLYPDLCLSKNKALSLSKDLSC